MPNSEMITRNYSVNLETREENESGILEGRPIVFGQRADIGGWFEEIIDPGALDSTDLTDVRLCLNHDTSYVYARSRRNNPNSTMQLFTDAEGLRIRANLDIGKSAAAQDLFSAITRKDIDKMSFCFSVKGEKWENLDTDYPTRHITEIGTVVEVSAVTFPAYEATSISARGKEALESAREALEKAKSQRAAEVETSDNSKDLELYKAKYFFKNH